jgi:hypothetical protein
LFDGKQTNKTLSVESGVEHHQQTKHYLLKVALNTINKQTKHYLLKVALNTIKQTNCHFQQIMFCLFVDGV